MERNLRHNPLYENYVTVIHGFAYVGHALEPYTRAGLERVHQDIYKRCAGLSPCYQQCSRVHKKDTYSYCGTCKAWMNHLNRRRRGSFSRWENTESWQWAGDYESIASVFLPPNWGDVGTSLSDISTASHIWSNCTEFNIRRTLLSCVKKLRNKHFAHNADLKVTDLAHTRVFDTLKNLLCSNAVQAYINIATCIQDLNRIANGEELTDVLVAIEDKPSSVVGRMSSNDTSQTIVSVCMARTAYMYNEIDRKRARCVRSRQSAGRRPKWTFWATATVISLVIMALLSFVKYPPKEDCISEMYTYPFAQDLPLLPYLQEHSILIGRRWLFKDIEKRLLKAKTSLKGIVLTADMGFGKSAIVKHLLCSKEHEKGHGITSHIVSFHVCKFDVPSTKDPQRFVFRLVGFLSTKFPQYGEVISMLPESSLLFQNELCRREIVACFDQGVLHPMLQLQYAFSSPQIVVIDGLDECTDERTGKNDIFELFKARYRNVPELLRFIITLRNSSDIAIQDLSKLKTFELGSNDKRNLEDITEFFEFKAAIDPNIRNISGGIQQVLKHSEGNFLYITHSLDLINNNGKAYSYPKTISDVYEKNFLRHFESKKEFYVPRQILEIVLASIYPLNRNEVIKILADSIHKQDVIKHMNKLVFCFRSNKEITFVHKSLHTWLTDKNNKQFRVSVESGHATISRYFLTQVNSSITDIVDTAIHVSESKDAALAVMFETAAHSYKIEQGTLHRLIWKTNSSVALHLLLNLKLDANALNEGNITPAFVAASKGHLNQLKLLYSLGANINFVVKGSYNIQSREQIDVIKHSLYCGYGLIHIAASFGHFDTVYYLVDQNKSMLSMRTGPGMTVSEIACENGHLNILKLVTDKGADVGHCLYLAAKRGHTHVIQWIAQTDVNVSCLSERNSTEALYAIFEIYNVSATLQTQINKTGLSIFNAFSMTDLWWIALQKSPLHAAVTFKHVNTAKVLIRYYPHLIHCVDAFGLTPFLLSVIENQTDIFEMLIDRVTKDRCRIKNDTLLVFRDTAFSSDLPICPLGAGYMHLDAILKRHHMTEILISRDVHLSWLRPDASSNSPIHYSACSGNTLFLKMFKNFNKVSFENIKSSNGSTPLHSAAICGSVLSLEVMIMLSAKVMTMVKDKYQRTLLHYVALREFHGNPAKHDWNQQTESLQIMKKMLKWPNVNINDTDSYLRNVLHYSLFNGNYLIVEYIYEKYQTSFKAMMIQKDIDGNSPVTYALTRQDHLEGHNISHMSHPEKCPFYDIFYSYCCTYEMLNQYIPSWEMGFILVLRVIREEIKNDFRQHYKQIIVHSPYLTTALLVFLKNQLNMRQFEDDFFESLPELLFPRPIMTVARHKPLLLRKCRKHAFSSPLHLIAYKSDAANLLSLEFFYLVFGYRFELGDLNCYDSRGYSMFHYALIGGNFVFAKLLLNMSVDVSTDKVSIKDIPNMMLFGMKKQSIIFELMCHDQISCMDTVMADFFRTHRNEFIYSDICSDGRSELSLVHFMAASGLETSLKLLQSSFGQGLMNCKNRDGLTPAYLWTLFNKRSSIEVFNISITSLPNPGTELVLFLNIFNNFPFRYHTVSLSCLLNNNMNLLSEIVACLRKIHRTRPSKIFRYRYPKDFVEAPIQLMKQQVYSLLNYRQFYHYKKKVNMSFAEKYKFALLQSHILGMSKSLEDKSHGIQLAFNYPGLKAINTNAYKTIYNCIMKPGECILFNSVIYQEYKHLTMSFITQFRNYFMNSYLIHVRHEFFISQEKNTFIKERLNVYTPSIVSSGKYHYRNHTVNHVYRYKYLNSFHKTVKYQYIFDSLNFNISTMNIAAFHNFKHFSMINMTGPLENLKMVANSSSYYKQN